MKLTKQLPAALSLACALLISSCSKEDVQTPQPQIESANEHSGAKTNAGEVAEPPYFAATAGVVGLEMPAGWTKILPANYLLAGTSTFSALWGNGLKSWIKPLPSLPTNVSANSMITTESYTGIASETTKMSRAQTVIKNLKPGKTYVVTFYVASTTTNENVGGWTSICAKSAEILIKPFANGNSVKASIDLMGKEGQWIKKSITFTTDTTSAYFVFSGLAPQGVGYSYTHLFVDRNSIRELTPFQPVYF